MIDSQQQTQSGFIARISTHAPRALACSLAIFGSLSTSQAQTTDNYFAGRTIKLIVTQATGGFYDIGARLIAQHWGRFIPGKPNVVVQSQTGSAGVGLANRFAAGADNDGTNLGVFQRDVPQYAFIGYQGVRFDPLKIEWIGSLSSYATDSYYLNMNVSHGAKTLDDLRNPNLRTRLGANNAGSSNLAFSLLAKEVFKLNVEIIRGYEGTAPIFLAQQRGEVDGALASLSTVMVSMKEPWEKHEVIPLVQFGRKTRLPELASAPTARELIKDPADMALVEFAELPFLTALPIGAPAGTLPERIKILQKAFMEMAKDPELKADAKKVSFDISPMDGDGVRRTLLDASKTPQAVMSRYNALLSAN